MFDKISDALATSLIGIKGVRIPLSRLTRLPNSKLAGAAPVLLCTELLMIRCTNGRLKR